MRVVPAVGPRAEVVAGEARAAEVVVPRPGALGLAAVPRVVLRGEPPAQAVTEAALLAILPVLRAAGEILLTRMATPGS